MSAFVGIYRLDGSPVDPGNLETMLASVADRGPDGTGKWVLENVGLGHQMLWTTPESLIEHLPLSSGNGDIALTADARIDNRSELIAQLGLKDTRPEEISDSALVLAAYLKWGEECPVHLLGDFAFIIWDRRNQKMFCACDHVGARKLYYYHSNTLFAFASEIKALLSLAEVPRKLNESMLARFLIIAPGESTTTLYDEIWRLAPAHCMTVNSQGKRIWRYWSLDPKREIRLGSDEAYAEAFREVFTEAVACRLRSAYPVGSMLSGGLDSSSIVCTARQLLLQENRSLHTFSATFPELSSIDPSCDERRFIDAVVRGGGVEAHMVPVDGWSPLLPILWQEDEPLPAPNGYLDWAVFKAASEQGVRVLFSGQDGDSVVYYGYEYLAELLAAGRLRRLMSETRALAGRNGRRRRNLLWKWALAPYVPEAIFEGVKRLQREPDHPWDDRSVINRDFATRKDMQRFSRALPDPFRHDRTVKQGHYQALNSFITPHLLELLGRLAAPYLLEMRYPFFDRRLMEFSLAIPGDQKLHQGLNRVVLRRAMAGILPREVQWRPGKGRLGVSFKVRLIEREQALLDEIIFGDMGLMEQYIDVASLRAMYGRYKADPMKQEDASFGVFWTICLVLWLQRTGLANLAS